MDRYRISLERIHISRTRAHNTDTNYLTFSVKSGTGAQTPTQVYAKLGDMPDGDYSVIDRINRTPQPSLGIGPPNASDSIEIVNPQDPVVISWAIVNRGHANDQQAISEIERISNKLLDSIGSGPEGMNDTRA